ncbi:GntR family transcriptional regulator [Paludibacterium denitrificans]|uniref:GntR family transcriptional regulator n=1 Tax=Paludibacterium denitrificans TaxID=2675226 RepID=UPI001E4D567B|nr:winged helix-turn-helix domain-containing protein [Paludibacterium denitrificans]
MSLLTRYQLLANDLAEAIAHGSLGGSRLPSIRAAAMQHQVSLNTVTAAYRLLEDRGLVEARPQSGYYVKSALPTPQTPLRDAPGTLKLPPAAPSVIWSPSFSKLSNAMTI